MFNTIIAAIAALLSLLNPRFETRKIGVANPSRMTRFRVLGLWFIFGWHGNCIWPCVHFERNGKWGFMVTLRTRSQLETRVYASASKGLWWNSGHLARRFGKFIDTDFGGVYQWGNHCDL